VLCTSATAADDVGLRQKHPCLDRERDEEHEVVAGDAQDACPRHAEHRKEEQAREQARARFTT
jgi:hypothetical protein